MDAKYHANDFSQARFLRRSDFRKAAIFFGLTTAILGGIISTIGIKAIQAGVDDAEVTFILGIFFILSGLLYASFRRFRMIFSGGNPFDVFMLERKELSKRWCGSIPDLEDCSIDFDRALFWGKVNSIYLLALVPIGQVASQSNHVVKEQPKYLIAHYYRIRLKLPAKDYGRLRWIPLSKIICGELLEVEDQVRQLLANVQKHMDCFPCQNTASFPDPIILEPLLSLKVGGARKRG